MDRYDSTDPLDIYRLNLLHRTEKNNIYLSSTNSSNFILKVSNSNVPNDNVVSIYENEFNIASHISHPVLRSSIQRTEYNGREAVFLEYVDGEPIRDYIFDNKAKIREFLFVAREIVSGLQALHLAHVMHLKLTSDHIIYNSKNKIVKIIGFGHASKFGSKFETISNQEIHEKDLRYISPEQTRRLKRDIDFRADFYSLGVIFYRMLTGVYPFNAKNNLNLIHLHILEEPLLVCDLNTNVPYAISSMISKLLSKHAEDRYQSTLGIIYDLDAFNAEIENDYMLSSIILAEHDMPRTFLPLQKQYGRNKEITSLLSIYDNMQQKSFEIVFVKGSTGMGKTALAFELCRPVIKRKGLYLYGKFDKNAPNPYSALIEIIAAFCEDLLLRDIPEQNAYKAVIREAVGEEGEVLTSLVSKLELLIGKQPMLCEASGNSAKNRLHYTLFKFFKAICSMGPPVVLVLDDLQWCDSDCHSFLKSIIAEKSLSNLMILLLYRDNEVTANHPISELVKITQKMELNSNTIELECLNYEDLNDFISNTFGVSSFESYSLTAVVHRITKSNPFFVHQMLRSLYDQNQIYFCNETLKWRWEEVIHCQNEVNEDVLEFLRQKISSFSKPVQDALKVASCLGKLFTLSVLNLLINNKKAIADTLSTRMITQFRGSTSRFVFAHDQIQQAANSLLPKECGPLYLHIGMKLWKSLPKDALKENLFVVVDLLKHSVELVKDQNERSSMARLFFHAGKRALDATAFEKALNIYNVAVELMEENCWESCYLFSLDLFNSNAEAAYYAKNLKRMEKLMKEISLNVKHPLHLVKSKCLQIRVLNDKVQYEAALRLAKGFLRDIGENIEINNFTSSVASEIESTKRIIENIKQEDILKPMSDEFSKSVMMIISKVLSSAYIVDRRLFSLLSSRIIQLTLEYGFSSFSAVGFSSFACILSTKGIEYHKEISLALQLLEKSEAKDILPHVYCHIFCFIYHTYASIHQTLDPIFNARRISLETGDNEGASNCACFYCHYALLAGNSINSLLEITEGFTCLREAAYLSTKQALINLSTKKDNVDSLNGEFFNFDSFFSHSHQRLLIGRLMVINCMTSYIFHDYKRASELLKTLKPMIRCIRQFYHYPISVFYHGLTSAALARKTNDAKFIDVLENSISILKHLTANAQENYANKTNLLLAELAVLESDHQQAIFYYEQAVKLSKQNGFLHEEAICCENLAVYYQQLEQTDSASKVMQHAYNCYKEWGCVGKLFQLEKTYFSLLLREKSTSIEKGYIIDHDLSHSSLSELTTASTKHISVDKKRRVIIEID